MNAKLLVRWSMSVEFCCKTPKSTLSVLLKPIKRSSSFLVSKSSLFPFCLTTPRMIVKTFSKSSVVSPKILLTIPFTFSLSSPSITRSDTSAASSLLYSYFVISFGKYDIPFNGIAHPLWQPVLHECWDTALFKD